MKRFGGIGLVAAMSAVMLAGCQQPKAKQSAPQPATGPVQLVLTIKPIGGGDPRDPQPSPGTLVRLVIFTLDLPPGAVSGDANFWKRVDEQAVGAVYEDRLLRNGIRSGVVPQGEGAFFSQYFDHLPHALSVSHVEGLQTETCPLQMDKQFDRQDLFFFNSSDQLEGRSYSHGTNQLMLTFGLNPRDPDAVRLTLCPVVRCEKMRLDYTPLNQAVESSVKTEDHIYDLGLTCDVPEGSFFIIAPGGDADRTTSMGGCFLTKAGKTERQEQVIVIVPTLLRMDGKPMTVRPSLIR